MHYTVYIARVGLLAGLLIMCALVAPGAYADPISTTPRFFFAGNIDYTVTGGTLRTASNTNDACDVGNTSSSMLSGIPGDANVVAAYLYWAGSGPTPDNTVTFQGTGISASRTFSENFSLGTLTLDFFSGFADVTPLVNGNGNYTFADLTVTNTDLSENEEYCSRQAVLSGWGLMVVYERSSEPLRVINVYDGFQQFRGSQIQVTPSNFLIPSTTVDGKIAILTWEGDVENSAENNQINENLEFDGQNTAALDLTDSLNPLNNQFNSTININNTSTSYGVDFDIYDISSRLVAGDTSATTTYASGGDLVLLSMQAVSTTNVEVADLALTKSLPSGNLSSGGNAQYLLSVSNQGPSDETTPITVTDTLPTGMTFLSASSADGNWTCSGSTTVTCTHPGAIAAGSSLADLTIVANVGTGVSVPATNSATVSSASFDPDDSNNTANHTANAIIDPVLTSSIKQVQDLNGGNLVVGDTVRYRITLTESAGAVVDGITLTDVLDSALTGITVVNDGGGTDASTASTLQISNLSIPANGTTTVVFDTQIASGTAIGTIIGNTAVAEKPAAGISISVDAPNITVGSPIIATSGIKPLYMGDPGGSQNNPTLPMPLTRVPLSAASNPARIRIRRQDNNRIWRLTPVLASSLGLDTDAIPVRLYMRRNNDSNDRQLRLTLTHGTTGQLIGCVDQTIAGTGTTGLSNGTTRAFDFNIVQSDSNCNPITPVPLTIPTGSFLELLIDNDPAGGNGRHIFVYPFDTTTSQPSVMQLPATTIINVDSVGWFDSPGGGTALTTVAAGQTVYIRATVSDPFGSADITAANFEILDATSATVSSGPMVEISSTAGTKTYEVAYTVPLTATNGSWSARVTADEGTEGTISHSGSGPITVTGGSGLRVEKSLVVLSDGTSLALPKAIPGAEVEYRIAVTNDGGNAIEDNSIVVADELPDELILMLGNPPSPATFSDGSPGSGLTFTFTSLASTSDDIDFSNDGGTTFVTPVVAADGSDATVPRINFVRINPKGTMPGNTGSAPSFEVLLRMRIP